MKEFENENLDMTSLLGWGGAMVAVTVALIFLFQGLYYRYEDNTHIERVVNERPAETTALSEAQLQTLNDPEITLIEPQKRLSKVSIEAAKGIALERLSKD